MSLAPGAPKTFLEKDGEVHQLLAAISSSGSHDLVDLVDLFRPTGRVRRDSRGTNFLSLASLVGVTKATSRRAVTLAPCGPSSEGHV